MLESESYTGAVYGGECWEQTKIILVATQPLRLDRGNLRTASSLRHGGHRDDDARRVGEAEAAVRHPHPGDGPGTQCRGGDHVLDDC